MARLIIDPNLIVTGKGIVKDLEKNAIEIIKKYFQRDDDFRFKNKITRYPIHQYVDADPDVMGVIDNPPGIYVWIEEFDGSVDGLGQQELSKHHAHMYYKMHIQYIEVDLQTNVKEALDRTKHIMSVLLEIILKENTFRQLVHGFVHHSKTSFEPDFKVIQNKFCHVHSGKSTLIIMNTMNLC